MHKLTVRLNIADYDRAYQLADAIGLSVPKHMRQVYLEHLKGMELEAKMLQTLQHYLAQTTAQIQANFRKQIELIDALDDRLTQSQAEFLQSLAQAVDSEKAGHRPSKPLFQPPSQPQRSSQR